MNKNDKALPYILAGIAGVIVAVAVGCLSGCSIQANRMRSAYIDTPVGPAVVVEANGKARVGSPLLDQFLGGDDGEFNLVDIRLGKQE